MNTRNIILSTIFLFFALFGVSQESETITVPLSNPGQAGKLELIIHNGDIHVESHNQSDVIVEISGSAVKEPKREERDGLRRIPNNAIDVDITEYNNVVEIKGTNKESDFKIKVPQNFSLVLGSHHNDYIVVKGVDGDMEVQTHHGSIELHDISGSVVAGTHHGEISVQFVEVDQDKPMAFNTYHGDIDISLPANFNGSTKIKSARGEVFTDFEMDIKTSPVSKNRDHKRNEIKLGGWIIGQIGSGGEEHMFTTHHGDVIIRKNK